MTKNTENVMLRISREAKSNLIEYAHQLSSISGVASIGAGGAARKIIHDWSAAYKSEVPIKKVTNNVTSQPLPKPPKQPLLKPKPKLSYDIHIQCRKKDCSEIHITSTKKAKQYMQSKQLRIDGKDKSVYFYCNNCGSEIAHVLKKYPKLTSKLIMYAKDTPLLV